MKILLSILVVFSAFFFFSSCEKEEGPSILGEWIWVESISGWGSFDPESTMLAKSLIITDNVFQEVVNDTLVFESKLKLRNTKDGFFGSEAVIMTLDNGKKFGIRITNNELALIEVCIDCYQHFYIRK